MSALDLAREHMARTGLDGYTLAVVMACTAACWQDATCVVCGRDKQRLGRDEGPGFYGCDSDCPGYFKEPKPPHLFRENDETRWYADLDWHLRHEAGEFREDDDG